MALGHNPSIVTTGLKLCFDAGNPRCYGGSGTSVSDASGNNNTSTLTNGPTYTSGVSGYFTLDGVNDYINNVTATTLGINNVSTPFTLSVWFRTSGAAEYYLFDNYSGATPDISFRIDAGKLEMYLSASNGSAFNAIQFGSGYNNNAWTNFAIVWDGVNTITAYANGVSLGTNTQAGLSGNFESNSAFQIGARPVSTSYLPGDVSNLLVYNIALTAAQISQNFNAIRGRYGI